MIHRIKLYKSDLKMPDSPDHSQFGVFCGSLLDSKFRKGISGEFYGASEDNDVTTEFVPVWSVTVS